MIKTVSGDISENRIGITLPHEHICCFSQYLYDMAGGKYLDKEELIKVSVDVLKNLKEKHNLSTFIDCTPVNIGRDVELLKVISEESGVNIICSTGFYHTREPLFMSVSADEMSEYIISDAKNVNAGIIKCAVQEAEVSEYDEMILRASAKAQKKLDLPMVIHTNAKNKNGIRALEVVMAEGVKPEAVTIAHLSDTDDFEYISKIAGYGCYLGLDRLYENCSDEYVKEKTDVILKLWEQGYGNKILLSHDDLIFNGFDKNPHIKNNPRFDYCFGHILPNLPMEIVIKITEENPLNMLKMM